MRGVSSSPGFDPAVQLHIFAFVRLQICKVSACVAIFYSGSLFAGYKAVIIITALIFVLLELNQPAIIGKRTAIHGLCYPHHAVPAGLNAFR